jgi:hypothetical protein
MFILIFNITAGIPKPIANLNNGQQNGVDGLISTLPGISAYYPSIYFAGGGGGGGSQEGNYNTSTSPGGSGGSGSLYIFQIMQ